MAVPSPLSITPVPDQVPPGVPVGVKVTGASESQNGPGAVHVAIDVGVTSIVKVTASSQGAIPTV